MNAVEALYRHRAELLRIADQHGARDVRVFGSVRRGEATEASDLDLLVRLDEGRDLIDLVEFKLALEAMLGCPVDVLTEGALSPYIRDAVLSEAVCV